MVEDFKSEVKSLRKIIGQLQLKVQRLEERPAEW